MAATSHPNAASGTNAAGARATHDRSGSAADAVALLRLAEARLAPTAQPLSLGEQAPATRDVTGILTQLSGVLGDLSGRDLAAAQAILARPTDSPDPQGHGWTTAESPNSPACTAMICVHWTDSSKDAPDLIDTDGDDIPDWVETTQATLTSVWTRIEAMGYRMPEADVDSASYDGDPRFDLYLAELRSQGLYGYCAPDDTREDDGYVYYDREAFCVLDNDFVGYGVSPLDALHVTAAHEFFHAVQFAYDAYEDSWFLESTATWMEEVLYDGANDNRQYLSVGSLGRPERPLDRGQGQAAYGNWIFWQFLQEEIGDPAVVRETWELADASPTGPDRYSVSALAGALSAEGTDLATVFADFAMANDDPEEFYSEGSQYDRPAAFTKRVRRGDTTGWYAASLAHLSSATARLKPSTKGTTASTLAVKVNLPSSRSQARVLVRLDDGRVRPYALNLNSGGNGTFLFTFKRAKVTSVDLVLVNTGHRYDCWTGDPYACSGTSLDDGTSFRFKATAS